MSTFQDDFAGDAWDIEKDAHGVAATYVDPSSSVSNTSLTIVIREAPTLTTSDEFGRTLQVRPAIARCHPTDLAQPAVRGRFLVGADDEAGIEEWTVTAPPYMRSGLWYAPVAYQGNLGSRRQGGV